MTKKYNGQLEIDSDRGVIYFHLSDEKDIEKLKQMTVLRICNLPVPIKEGQIDITNMVGVSYNENKFETKIG